MELLLALHEKGYDKKIEETSQSIKEKVDKFKADHPEIQQTAQKCAENVKKAQDYIGKEPFMLTYGDGVSDVDINKLLECHKKSGKYLTLTAVKPSGKFGALDIADDGLIHSFKEKPQGDGNWINGGFMVCEPEVFDYISSNKDDVIFEREPLENLAKDGQLNSYKHSGFWYPMDTLKGKTDLTEMWQNNQAPWAKWISNEVAYV